MWIWERLNTSPRTSVRSRSTWAGLGSGLALLLGLSVQPQPASGAAAKETVLLIGAQAEQESLTLTAEALVGTLRDLGLILEVEIVANGRGLGSDEPWLASKARARKALLLVWCDFSSADQIVLYLNRPAGDSVIRRTVSREQDGALARFEAIAAIVRATLESILPGQGHGSGNPRQPPWSWSIAAAGLMGIGFPGAASHWGAGLSAGLILRRRWSAVLGYSFYPEVTRSDASVRFAAAEHDLTILGVLEENRLASCCTLRAELGLLIGFLPWRVRAGGEPPATNRGINLSLGPRVAGGVGVNLSAEMRLVLGAGFSFYVSRPQFSYSKEGILQDLGSCWNPQPFLFVELVFSPSEPARRP